MTGAQLTAAFRAQNIPIDVRFQADQSIRVAFSGFPAAATVTATIEDGKLVLRPVNKVFKRFSFALTLPELVPGLTYRSITFDGNLGTLAFTMADATFAVNGSAG
jgi:hypothetical protein